MINANSSTPLYQQLANLLRDQIHKGDLKIGDRIPSEAELGKMYGISRITIRQALAELEKEGLLEKIPGKGTFIKNNRKIQGLTRLTGFNEVTAAAGLKAGYRIIEIDSMAFSEEAKTVFNTDEPSFFMVKRVLLASGSPVGMHTSYLPSWLIHQDPDSFTSEILSHSSLHATIEKTGVRLYRAEEIVEPALAGEEEIEHLGLKMGDLVLQVKRTIFDFNNQSLLYEIDIYRPDSYTYRIESYR
ncbi:GntR family transcriptional regulator [Neobacillus muris]|uniref:GntR family transcriptional regulator n=1 Tax=Neobacillus muris TaxID=2941334 RepID=UPI00203C0673|nr:GntR family transcriptional regulator [Neobacillus muris]